MANTVSSDLLSENPDQAISQFGPHRVVPDRWKGMTQDQLRRIREEQQNQLEEKKVRILGKKSSGTYSYVSCFFLLLCFSVVMRKNVNVKTNGIDDEWPKLKLG